jgi:hypothetical protein
MGKNQKKKKRQEEKSKKKDEEVVEKNIEKKNEPMTVPEILSLYDKDKKVVKKDEEEKDIGKQLDFDDLFKEERKTKGTLEEDLWLLYDTDSQQKEKFTWEPSIATASAAQEEESEVAGEEESEVAEEEFEVEVIEIRALAKLEMSSRRRKEDLLNGFITVGGGMMLDSSFLPCTESQFSKFEQLRTLGSTYVQFVMPSQVISYSTRNYLVVEPLETVHDFFAGKFQRCLQDNRMTVNDSPKDVMNLWWKTIHDDFYSIFRYVFNCCLTYMHLNLGML